jgi:rhodanese-related sulfurtransferase
MATVETRAGESLGEIFLRAEERARARKALYRGDLTPEEAWHLLREHPDAKLVDVRTLEEWTLVGRVPGAIEIAWRLFDAWVPNPGFLEEAKKILRPNDVILLLCRSGVRSREAGALLSSEGFCNCFNILEGFEGDKNKAGQRVGNGWKARGLPWSQ